MNRKTVVGGVMRTIYDLLPVDVVCNCGQELFELAGRLQKSPYVTCSACKSLVTLGERELQEKVEGLHGEFDELTRSMKCLRGFAHA